MGELLNREAEYRLFLEATFRRLSPGRPVPATLDALAAEFSGHIVDPLVQEALACSGLGRMRPVPRQTEPERLGK